MFFVILNNSLKNVQVYRVWPVTKIKHSGEWQSIAGAEKKTELAIFYHEVAFCKKKTSKARLHFFFSATTQWAKTISEGFFFVFINSTKGFQPSKNIMVRA